MIEKNEDPKSEVIYKPENSPIKKNVQHIKIPQSPVLDEEAQKYSFVDITDNIAEAENDLSYVTGKANKDDIRNRIDYLKKLLVRNPERGLIESAHAENYEAFMSFSPAQKKVLEEGFSILNDVYIGGGYGDTAIKRAFGSLGVTIPHKDLEGKSYLNIPHLSRTSNVDVGVNDIELKRDVASLVAAYKEKRKDTQDTEATRLVDPFIKRFDAVFPESEK